MAQPPKTPAQRAPAQHDPAVRVTSNPTGREADGVDRGALDHQPARGPVAPDPTPDNRTRGAESTVTVQAAGQAPVTVRVEAEEDDEPTGKVKIVTTAKGVLDHFQGIAPVGTEAEIDIARFSDRWMEPASAADKRKLVKAGKLEQ